MQRLIGRRRTVSSALWTQESHLSLNILPFRPGFSAKSLSLPSRHFIYIKQMPKSTLEDFESYC